MPATNTGAPFSLNVPSLSSDLADLFGTYLVPNMTAINTNAAHKGTAQTFSALQTFSAGLTTSSGSASAPSIAPSGNSNTGTFYPAADTIAWATGGSERVRVNSSGNVGIGTSSPASTLHLAKSGGAVLRVTTETGGGGGYSSILLGNQDSLGTNKPTIIRSVNADLFIGNGDSWSSETGGTLTSRMVVTSSGSVGIGTSSPQQLLHVLGNVLVGSGNKLYIQNPNGENPYLRGSDVGGQHNVQVVSPTGTVRLHVDTYGGNVGIGTSSPGYQLTLSTDSAAKPTSNTWTISSDARVKTVLGDFTRGLMDIVGLMPKRYHLNGAYGTVDDGREHVSVIAQDVQTTWPAMVGEYTHVEKDEEAGTETETTLLSLNTNELQWALVNAIKELTARVVALEAQVASA